MRDYSIFEDHYNIPVEKDIRSMFINKKKIIKEIKSIMENKEYDIVHSHNAPDNLGAWCTKYLDIPVVHDIHDVQSLTPIKYSGGTKKIFIRILLNHWERYVCNNSAAIIIPSRPLKDLIKKKYKREKNIFIVGNKPIIKKITKKKKLSKQSKGEIHLVFAGSLPFGDNSFRDVLPTYNIMAKKPFHIHVYPITFNEQIRKNIVDFCKKNEYLHYHEPVPQKELISELTQYDYGLHILNFAKKPIVRFSSPNKIHEYAAAGIPVVSNSYDYLAEYIKNNNLGIVLEKDVWPPDLAYLPEPYELKAPKDVVFLQSKEILRIYEKVLGG